jgi:hypothetical protein
MRAALLADMRGAVAGMREFLASGGRRYAVKLHISGGCGPEAGGSAWILKSSRFQLAETLQACVRRECSPANMGGIL